MQRSQERNLFGYYSNMYVTELARIVDKVSNKYCTAKIILTHWAKAFQHDKDELNELQRPQFKTEKVEMNISSFS